MGNKVGKLNRKKIVGSYLVTRTWPYRNVGACLIVRRKAFRCTEGMAPPNPKLALHYRIFPTKGGKCVGLVNCRYILSEPIGSALVAS